MRQYILADAVRTTTKNLTWTVNLHILFFFLLMKAKLLLVSVYSEETLKPPTSLIFIFFY